MEYRIVSERKLRNNYAGKPIRPAEVPIYQLRYIQDENKKKY